VALDDSARTWAVGVASRLRRSGVHAEYDVLARSMKAQMRDANRRGASLAVIAGGNEMEEQVAQVKDMAENEQKPVPFSDLEQYLVSRCAIL
jgi:histidyl-tRNA synthetase